MKKVCSHQQIMDYLKKYYAISVDELILLPLGADINASIYKAKTAEMSYFVKIMHGHQHDVGIAILALLQHKIPLIIPSILTTQGESIQRIDDVSLMVQPFIDGENCFSHVLTAEQWFALGKSLKSIHETVVPPSIQAQLRKETFSPQWRDKVKNFYYLLEDDTDFKTVDELSKELLIFLKLNKTKIHTLVQRAEELAKKCQLDASSFALCHADLHGGNVLVNDNALYIVDWDNPMMAPKERDLMFVGGGVGHVWNKQSEVELFYKGYGEVTVDMHMLAYYRYERIVEDVAIYIHQILFTDDINRAKMYKELVDQFAHRGVIEIAF